MTNEQAAVVKRSGTSTAVSTLVPSAEAMAPIREALAPGESLSVDLLDRAKWPTGGGSMFEFKAGGGSKDIEGILILRQPVKVYWKEKFAETGGGQPPDCFSMDNVSGHGDNGEPGTIHDCAKCPLAEWGTATNEKGEATAGKACRQVTRAFMLRDGKTLPMLVPVPPSSYKAMQFYVLNMGLPYYAALTRLTTEQIKSRPVAGTTTGPINYAVAKFEMVRPLTEDELAGVKAYRDEILPFLNALSVVEVEGAEAQ